MNINKKRWFFALLIGLLLFTSVSAQTFRIKDFYQLVDGNEWRYTAHTGWKDGDYISRIEKKKITATNYGNPKENRQRQENTFYHYDATNAAKILHLGKKGEIFYDGEVFADGSKVDFTKQVLWFPKKVKIGDEMKAETSFVRTFKDETVVRGTFKISQKIASLEDVQVSAGEFKKTLRIESETFWDLGDGRKARSINIYNYAKNIGVVKASARFIIINEEGREIINRLIETDLKSYKIRK